MNTFKIKPFQNPSGTTVFRVVGTLNGKHIRENHKTQVEAITAKQGYEREANNLTPLPAVTTRLTADQAAEAEAAFHRLNGGPLTMTKAIDFALKNYAPSAKPVTVTFAVQAFLQAKRRENVRPDTLRNLDGRLQSLMKTHGGDIVGELQPDTLKPFIFGKGSMLNQRNNHLVFTNFFNWCQRNKYVAVSPLENIGSITIDREQPEILTLPQVRALVHAASAYKGGVCLPYVVAGLFCGIRPKEISRIKWDDVNLKTNTVSVSGKLRGRRMVDIPQNASAFLLTHAIRKTPFVGSNWRKDFDKVKTLAGLTSWPQDVMRHTAITHHFAQHHHEGKTASWAGNSPDVIHRYYKGLINDPQDTVDFWAITPESLDNITTLNTKAA
jgi:integrase